MRWLIGLTAAITMAGQATAEEPPANVEVMVLGTYHMANPGLDLINLKTDDVLKPRRQKELEALAAALAEYRPTKIAVERVARTPALIDQAYAEFAPGDLKTNRDERYQIAYRLARQLGQKTVYAIDEERGSDEPDYFPFGKVAAWAKANGQEAQLDAELEKAKAAAGRIEKLQADGSIAHALAGINRPDQDAKDQSWYYGVFRFGDVDAQPGAELNAYWYMRNAKIFAKLMRIAAPGDRVLVVYGSGHNYWLRHFAAVTPGYRNVDPTPYLRKAEAVSR